MTEASDNESRLDRLERIVESNARAIQANSNAIAENTRAIAENTRTIGEFRDAVRQSFEDTLGLVGLVIQQQQQNTRDIADLRATIRDWFDRQRGNGNGGGQG